MEPTKGVLSLVDPTESHFVNFVEFTETRGLSKFITRGGQNSSATGPPPRSPGDRPLLERPDGTDDG